MLVGSMRFFTGGLRVFAAIGSAPSVSFIGQGFGFFSSGGAICIDTDPPSTTLYNKGFRVNLSGAIYGTTVQSATDVWFEGLRRSALGQIIYESADAAYFVNGNPITAAGNFAVN
jgi:hypothetical protein